MKLSIDVPNQINPKQLYVRGYSYSRQIFAREEFPFVWHPVDFFKRRYEEPLALKQDPVAPARERIVLEFMREDGRGEYSEEEREKMRYRKLTVGSCKLLDPKLEKNGAYEITPAV